MADNVIPFKPKKSKKGSNELIDLVNEYIDENGEDQIATNQITVSGSSNIIGNNNFSNSGTININSPKINKIHVKTGDGTINAEQKSNIKTLVYEWIDTHNQVKKNMLSYQVAWIRFNKKMKVNTYHEIKDSDYDKAIKVLRTLIGQIKNMNSAPKKVSDWRTKTIRSIQTKCRQNDWNDWRKDHMNKKFGCQSMTELTDKELQALYRTVWNKK